MKPRCCWLVLCFILGSHLTTFAGPLTRVPNTTLTNVPPAPPTFGYTATNAFPGLVFTNPMCVATPAGETNRLFVVERRGIIAVITNLAAPTRTTFLEITNRVFSSPDTTVEAEEGLLGLAFHPDYATNGYFYVFYTGRTNSGGVIRHDILSRFSVSLSNPNQGDTNSEVRLIAQPDQAANHNGGDLHFGPDGYLYVSLGDEGNFYDTFANSQRINKDFFSAMIRIDVDKKPGSLTPNPHAALPSLTNYAIPPDNPWIGATNFNGVSINATNVRTEFWSVGLRNPWRFAFDPVTGLLYVGDVGQDTLESVQVLTNGANAGWNFFEGTKQWTNSLPSGFIDKPPIIEYGHTNGRICVIGGIVYRGDRISQLTGSYLYADHGTGEIWALRYSGTNVTENTILFTDNSAAISSFGVDPSNDDALYTALRSGTNSIIKRIIYNGTNSGPPLPPTLADTGAFTNLMSLTSATNALLPADGIVPYDLNVAFWSDNAIKQRWFSVPKMFLTIGFNPNGNWSFPTGTIWIKHFNLQLTNGSAASTIRLETRLLVKNAQGTYGMTYRWGGSQTNAVLVPEGGLDETFAINDGGTIRTQLWRYPSRNECAACHTAAGGYGLGFRTEQLNKNFTYPGGTTNQIIALSDAGYFTSPVTNNVQTLYALATATNTSASLEFRSRSFLSANCSQCHQPAGTGQALWDARITTPTALAGLINGPLLDNWGDTNNHVITPLQTNDSVLLTRIATRDLSSANSIQMPPLASHLVDTQAVALITEWIMSLTNRFWVGATPDPLSLMVGNSGNYVVTVVPTPDFTNTISLSVSGLPSGTTANFVPPSVTGSNTASLNITTTGATPLGSYTLTISGTGSGQTNSSTATLAVTTTTPPVPGILLWTGGGADKDWSTPLNWTNLTAGTNSVPGPANDLVFSNTAAVATFGATNNIADYTIAINSLWYGITTNGLPNTNHTTLINPGVTLDITGIRTFSANGVTANPGLLVGSTNSNGNNGNNPMTAACIKGPGGTLNVNNVAADVFVAQFSTQTNHPSTAATRAVLDLSGLSTFNANVARVLVGAWANGSAGTLMLARTNVILASSGSAVPGVTTFTGIEVGNNNANAGESSFLCLGLTNAIYADTLRAGTAKGFSGSIAFNAAFTNSSPRALFRGSGGNTTRVATWIIGDLSAANGTANVTSPRGTNDFTGGWIDALVGDMALGRTTATPSATPGIFVTSNRIAIGTLMFNSGTLNANNLTNGWQIPNSGSVSLDTSIGIINVSGSAKLSINNNLVLAFGTTNQFVGGTGASTNSHSQGTLIINGGSVFANHIISGGGISAILLSSGGTLAITNKAGTPNAPIGALNTTNSTLRFNVNGSAIVTNLILNTLSAGGTNTLAIDSVANITTVTTFPLVRYNTANSLSSFVLGSLPPGYVGILVTNPAQKRIDVSLAPVAAVTPRVSSALRSGTNLIVAGSNGWPSGNYYVRSSTNVVLPLSNWPFVSTNAFDSNGRFRFTNTWSTNPPRRFYILQLP